MKNRKPQPVSIRELRKNLRQHIDGASKGQPRQIMRHSEPMAVLVGSDQYAKMISDTRPKVRSS